jgi:predicted membrane protein (TIGR00267 family)
MKKYLNRHLFAVVMGFVDGILTVLTLATGRILNNSHEDFSFSLAIRVALVTSLSGICVFFISQYSRERQRLIVAEKELNLSAHGKFATTNLGKKIFTETFQSMMITGLCSFIGSFIPISGAVFFPDAAWISIALALLILGTMGFGVSKLVYGKSYLWVLSLIFIGVFVSFIGYQLHVI